MRSVLQSGHSSAKASAAPNQKQEQGKFTAVGTLSLSGDHLYVYTAGWQTSVGLKNAADPALDDECLRSAVVGHTNIARPA